MVRSPRFFIISLSVLALGVSLHFMRQNAESPSSAKSVDAYWSETDLGAASLEDLLQSQTCVSSERYFLACANAVISIANRFNLTVTTDGQVVPVQPDQDLSTEKKQLAPWKEFYHQDAKAAAKVSFLKIWKKLESKYIGDKQKSLMVGMGLNGFISVFRDPHTYLMPVAMFKEVVSKADSRMTTVGIQLGRSNNRYAIRKVLEGSAAQKAGLKKGDILLEINNQDVTGLLQARVSELLKGDEGSKVKIEVSRDGEKITKRLVRSEVQVATITTQVIDGIKPIAVIGLNKFAKGSCEKVKEAIQVINKTDVRGMLFDLRDNPGGQMEEASCIASLFVGGDQMIFELRYLDSSKKPEEYYGGETKIFSKPMAVLINAGSASAAEIVAGALRDLNRAVLVGERTFGKGSFQEGEYWSQNKKIALFETKGFYYLPSGRSPQMKGLTPDVAVNFDNISVGREEDQFVSSLHAPERRVRELRSLISNNDCLEMEDGTSSEDAQLNKARQVLFCAKAVAGVN